MSLAGWTIVGAILGGWLMFAGIFGRIWTWNNNKKRRMARRRANKKNRR